VLQIKPIISCDEMGLLYLEKVRGRKQSIQKLIEIVQNKSKIRRIIILQLVMVMHRKKQIKSKK